MRILDFRFTVLISFLLSGLVCQAGAQRYPHFFYEELKSSVLLDAGFNWEQNSHFHPFKMISPQRQTAAFRLTVPYQWVQKSRSYTYKDFSYPEVMDSEKGSLVALPGFGFEGQTGSNKAYDGEAHNSTFLGEISLHKHFYTRLTGRATNKVNSLDHYSGADKRNRDRGSWRSVEFDEAHIGYQNGWFNAELGRGREVWGAGEEGNILLSSHSPSWEMIKLHVSHQRFSYRWFFGFLETMYEDSTAINRYMVGRALEYRNFSNLVVTIGEVVMFSGENRPLDMSMLNPIALQMELETNSKDNNSKFNHSNTIMFATVDWLLTQNLRFSGFFGIDDFQLDNRDGERADALGYYARVAWSPIKSPIGMTFFSSYNRNDTYFLIHESGYNNNVIRDEPIGTPLGNDAEDLKGGVRVVFPKYVIASAMIGQRQWGDYSILLDPYIYYDGVEDFIKLPFPSGEVRKNVYAEFKLFAHLHSLLYAYAEGHLDLHTSGTDSDLEQWRIGIQFQFPLFKWSR